MFQSCLLALTLAAPGPKESPFPLWTDPPPKEWKLEEINNGLPYRWEKGTVHVLAWEVIVDDRPHEFTQILVFKRFDQPTEKDGHRWVLGTLLSRLKGQGVAMARADADPGTAATRREDAQPDRCAALGLRVLRRSAERRENQAVPPAHHVDAAARHRPVGVQRR